MKGKEKRVAPGGNIDTKNIIEGSRRRRTSYDDSDEEPRPKKVKSTKEKKTKTVKKQQEETKPQVVVDVKSQVESVTQNVVVQQQPATTQVVEKKTTTKGKNTKISKSDPIVEEALLETKTKETIVVEQPKPTPHVEPTKKDVSNLGKNILAMEVERLGGHHVTWMKPTPRRRYRDMTMLIPIHIQEFCDAWGQESKDLEADKFSVRDFKFGQEFALKNEEYLEFQFFIDHPDAIIIGDGTKLVCTLMTDLRADFEIWLVEENKEPIGPMPISNLLKELKVKSN